MSFKNVFFVPIIYLEETLLTAVVYLLLKLQISVNKTHLACGRYICEYHLWSKAVRFGWTTALARKSMGFNLYKLFTGLLQVELVGLKRHRD
jgi:hypothetical protein